ncbi:hypothetical protein P7K49_023985 [Saguinus oedipus]|uniref:Uncharacterized protein n=1 Tax=Saguinus oedipus TaxID=9490 RepID=A0ABQ9UN98_SAGOE|nr:hypothetical protein P7K49_023985 [Saguinus oedipus]
MAFYFSKLKEDQIKKVVWLKVAKRQRAGVGGNQGSFQAAEMSPICYSGRTSWLSGPWAKSISQCADDRTSADGLQVLLTKPDHQRRDDQPLSIPGVDLPLPVGEQHQTKALNDRIKPRLANDPNWASENRT